MSQAILQAEPRRKGDALGLSLEPLQMALDAKVPGREHEWALAVTEALTRVEAALRQHRASAKAPDGLLAEVDETRPTLARQADELRKDHDCFLKQIIALRQEACHAAEAFQPVAELSAQPLDAGIVDFSAMRHQAERLLTALQENKEAEVVLVLESINTDIGAGD
jgi:hypothetical protein